MNSKNINSQDSQENSEVRRNAQMQENTSSAKIAAVHMIYNEHEKYINARGFEKEFPTEKEKNPAEEIYIQAFDSRENEVGLSLSSLNEMEANRDRRMTRTAIEVRKMKKQRIDNSMQK